MGVVFFLMGIIVIGFLLAGPVLFTVLAMYYQKKKPVRITFIVLAAVSFVPAAALVSRKITDITWHRRVLLASILAAVLFTALAAALRKEKTICVWFTALSAVSFVAVLFLTYDLVKDFYDDTLNISSQIVSEAAAERGDPDNYCRAVKYIDSFSWTVGK